MNPQQPQQLQGPQPGHQSPHQAIRMEGLQNAALQKYRRVAWLTIAAVYCLILIGASVRASGAGMGCPDWPTCFGRWIPPVSEAQLPADYQITYAHLGYSEARFDPLKTWTEYGNRLAGLLIGFLILLTAWRSWACRHYDWRICIASVAALLQVMVQGWLGAQVVGSNLQPGMITVHTLMALLITGTLLYGASRAQRSGLPGVLGNGAAGGLSRGVARAIAGGLPGSVGESLTVARARSQDAAHRRAASLRLLIAAALILTLLQIGLGTQVREMTDVTAREQGESMRQFWIQAQPWFYYVHRSLSAAVLGMNLYLAWLLLKTLGSSHRLTRFAIILATVTVLATLSGITLGHLGMPAAAQPAHLLLASILFGLQYLLYLRRRETTESRH